MTRVVWYLGATAVITVAIVSALHFMAPASAQETEQSGQDPCCFVHPYYPGVCVVEPVEGETCESILQYLNTPGTAGKAYCKNTLLRGGWEKVDCPAGEEGFRELSSATKSTTRKI